MLIHAIFFFVHFPVVQDFLKLILQDCKGDTFELPYIMIWPHQQIKYYSCRIRTQALFFCQGQLHYHFITHTKAMVNGANANDKSKEVELGHFFRLKNPCPPKAVSFLDIHCAESK